MEGRELYLKIWIYLLVEGFRIHNRYFYNILDFCVGFVFFAAFIFGLLRLEFLLKERV